MKKQLALVALFVGAQLNAGVTDFFKGHYKTAADYVKSCATSVKASSYYSVPAGYVSTGVDFVTATPLRQAGLVLTAAAAAKLAMMQLDARVNAALKNDDQRQAYQVVSNAVLAVATLGGLYYVYSNAPKAVEVAAEVTATV